MIEQIKQFFTKTIKRQLIIAIGLTHAIMMSIFIYDLTTNQKDFLHNQSLSQTISLTSTLSKNATSWVLANDFIGMEEIIESILQYPSLQYAMLLDTNGKVLAHTQKHYINKYIIDKVSLKIFNSKPKTLILINNINIIDVAIPILRDKQHIGWARVSLSQENNIQSLKNITNTGMIYTLIAIIVGTFFAYILAISLTKGLNNLIYIAQEIANGKRNLRADTKRVDEIGILAIDINKMLDKIEENEKQVKDGLQKNIDIQKQLFKSEKMASMGEMIGNIAHQWRQPLSVISTGATGMKMQKEFGTLTDKQFNKNCDIINNHAQYLSKTIDDFRDFIKGDRKKAMFNLTDDITSFMHLVEGTIKSHNINIILDLEENININGYQNELIQCLINIFNNAKDVLEDKKIDNKLIFISSVTKGNNVTIKIKDNAGGIPNDILPKIFDPYFTTKHKKQGTGLGLHMTYNLIVDGMNGIIEANNVSYTYNGKEFNGALFKITLPLN